MSSATVEWVGSYSRGNNVGGQQSGRFPRKTELDDDDESLAATLEYLSGSSGYNYVLVLFDYGAVKELEEPGKPEEGNYSDDPGNFG